MLCVTGAEPTLDAVVARIEALPEHLHEARLDCLGQSGWELKRLRPYAQRVIATLRTAAQGGHFAGTRSAYEDSVSRVLHEHAGLVDVEWEPAVRWEPLIGSWRDRVVMSWHGRTDDDGELRQIAAWMNEQRVAVRKMALHVDDAADIGRLRILAERLAPPYVVIGLGEAGRASRVLYGLIGSAWTFVSASAAVPGAPGQLSLSEAAAAIPERQRASPLGIVGGQQVASSPGLSVYNRVYRKRALPYSYVPWPTARLADSLRLMQALGFLGVSVTMPHKQTALSLCRRVDGLARRVGAVNTLVRSENVWDGYNTDAGAVREAVRRAGGASGMRAAVLGAGGAARAAVVALVDLGMTTDVIARRPETAGALGQARTCPWDGWSAADYDVIVNATPAGSDGRTCPVPQGSDLAGRIVMEMIHTPERTPFIELARGQGAHVITGRDMWVLQGVEQMRLLLGIELGERELAEAWEAVRGLDVST